VVYDNYFLFCYFDISWIALVDIVINRRGLITGLVSFVTTPAIVKVSSLMPVKVMDSFNPEEVLTRLLAPYCGPTIFNQFRLFWINGRNEIVQMPIEDSNAYLDSLS
jgi:hypothetical protein